MSNDTKLDIIAANDWSLVAELNQCEIACAGNINNVSTDNMGLYLDEKGRYHTSGFVGVRKIRKKDGSLYFDKSGKQVALHVMPRFELDPWEMLLCVMKDSEFDDYLESDENRFYEIFYDEEPIQMKAVPAGGEILLALSFVKCCNKICRGNLKKKMDFENENLVGTIRGQIDINNHIKHNVLHGREDRIYCRYPEFSEDTLENRILKRALCKAEMILTKKCKDIQADFSDVRAMIRYCKRALGYVNNVQITKKDFSNVSVNGFNSKYKSAIKLARTLLTNCAVNIDEAGNMILHVLPYAIKMEALFEFYVRAKIKKYLETENLEDILRVDKYRSIKYKSELLYTLENEMTYLLKNYIPDIAIQVYDKEHEEWNYVSVFDVKYQRSHTKVNSDVRRHNSHQLLFYMLMLNVKRCGFIFPKENYNMKSIEAEKLNLKNGNASSCERYYTEIILSKDQGEQKEALSRLLVYSVSGE